MNIKQRHFIKSSDIKTLKDDILKHYDQNFITQIFPAKCKIELILTEAGDTLYAVNDVLALWRSKDGYIPILTLLLNKQIQIKTVVVDMGAIRLNGSF